MSVMVIVAMLLRLLLALGAFACAAIVLKKGELQGRYMPLAVAFIGIGALGLISVLVSILFGKFPEFIGMAFSFAMIVFGLLLPPGLWFLGQDDQTHAIGADYDA